MADKFPIIEVSSDAPEQKEDLGTKQKFWFRHPNLGSCLFKTARQDTGEDWSEKIAAQLSNLLGLPHANYELATFEGLNGTISPSFLPEGGVLTLGNEILSATVDTYPQNSKDLSQHTVNNISNALENAAVNLPINWIPPQGISSAMEIFVGYLLLDTWIGNSDRHHENWAFITLNNKIYLAPTYDHASSMGREMSDEKRQLKLNNNSVTGYAQKCTSLIYASDGNQKRLKTFDAFREAQQRYPQAGKVWLNNLARVSSDDTLELFERIPSNRISETAIRFAQKILQFNHSRLIKLQDTL